MLKAKNSAINSDANRLHTGYLISRYGKLRGTGNDFENEGNDYDKEIETTVF